MLGLVGVEAGEAEDGVVEAVGGAEVGGHSDGIAGAGVAAGEELAADVRVAEQRGRRHLLEVE